MLLDASFKDEPDLGNRLRSFWDSTVIPAACARHGDIADKFWNEDELRQLISFWDSDVGRKSVAIQVPIQVECQKTFAELMPTFSSDISSIIDAYLEEKKQIEQRL